MLKDFSISVIRTLREQGFQAYLVGGCVRDLLLGREPKDYDVATNATPKQVMEDFSRHLCRWSAVRRGAGTCARGRRCKRRLRREGASKSGCVEVATFRADIGYSDGRHPDEVRYSGDPREDVARRDFTINGMMLDPMSRRRCSGLRWVDAADFDAGMIRAIGDPERRFTEDKLRMLRAVRFAARFKYEIEPGTFAAIQGLAREIISCRGNGFAMN